MNISAIFDTEYNGNASGAVWLVESETNRNWYDRQSDLDPNSALFLTEMYGTSEKAVCHMIWSIQDHFADWETITVIGMDLVGSISNELRDDGRIETKSVGFILHKS